MFQRALQPIFSAHSDPPLATSSFTVSFNQLVTGTTHSLILVDELFSRFRSELIIYRVNSSDPSDHYLPVLQEIFRDPLPILMREDRIPSSYHGTQIEHFPIVYFLNPTHSFCNRSLPSATIFRPGVRCKCNKLACNPLTSKKGSLIKPS
jgi:hypothetical protein